MQRTAQLNWLGTLAALAVLTAGLAQAATITINSGDVVWNPSGTGSAEIRYAAGPDAYYLNSNTTAPIISGYKNGLSGESHSQRFDEGGGTVYICASAVGSTPAVLVWNFNTAGQLLQNAKVFNSTLANDDGPGNHTSVVWEVSLDNSTWIPYQTIVSNNTDGGDFHDLTSYVKGYSNFYIAAVLQPYSYFATPQIFRSSTATYGLDVIMTVPEPASLGLLALGGLFVLRRRRN